MARGPSSLSNIYRAHLSGIEDRRGSARVPGYRIRNQRPAGRRSQQSCRQPGGVLLRKRVVATTLPPHQVQGDNIQALITGSAQEDPRDVEIGKERFLAASIELSGSGTTPVRLTVLGSYDQATKFVDQLNRYLSAAWVWRQSWSAADWYSSSRIPLLGHWVISSKVSELSRAATFTIRWIPGRRRSRRVDSRFRPHACQLAQEPARPTRIRTTRDYRRNGEVHLARFATS